MQLIEVTKANLENQHICCAISKTADAQRCARVKKSWMADRFAEGYHFWKLDAPGKVMIEFTPAENAWCPVLADGWMFIDCFWVSGKYKGQGYASQLLQKAKDAARAAGCKGLVALAGSKKLAFLSDGGLFKHKGFVVADTAPPYYELLALPFEEGGPLPRFAQSVKQPQVPQGGFVVYYSGHCPHPSKYVPLLQALAAQRGIPFTPHKLETAHEAQAATNPFTTYAMFYDGQFVTNEIFSEGKMQKFLDGLG